MTDVKQPTPSTAAPDQQDPGADDLRDEPPRHPSRGQDTRVIDDDGRAASGGAQIGRNRSARANGGRSDTGRSIVQRQQPDPGDSPAIRGGTHRAADYRRYRGTPHGFRAEPGPAARVGEPIPKRSDAAVTQDVHDFLMRDGLLDLEELDVRVQDGCVELHGRTRTERGAYQAAELAQHVAGVREVTNCLDVSEPGSAGLSEGAHDDR